MRSFIFLLARQNAIMNSGMKQFMVFVQKEFYHIFRDKRTVLILLVMPIVQIILFGFAITTEVKNSRVAIYDPSNDEVTAAVVEKFENSKYFEVSHLIGSEQEITDVFNDGKTSIALVFSENFSDNMYRTDGASLQIVTDGTDPNQASTLVGYASGIINSYIQEKAAVQKIPMQIVPQIKMLYNPQMEGAYNFVPGVMAMILMLICAMMTSIAIVREKESGTMEILLASPLKPIFIILSKIVPYFTLSVLNLITILILSVFVLNVPIAGSLFWLVVVSLIFIFLSLALGLLISTIVDTQVAAMLISGMVLMMPVVMLSGMMFPISSMPKILQYVSCVMPARWYIEVVKKIMIQGADIVYALKEICILGGMCVVLIGLSLKNFKTRLG